MKVSDLAAELDVPPSAVLEQCQRFGIDASWAGAELDGADLVVLRAELANAGDPIDLRPADIAASASEGAEPRPVATVVETPPPTEPIADPAAAVEVPSPTETRPSTAAAAPVEAGSTALPPTAVSSMPGAAGGPEPSGPATSDGGFRMPGATLAPGVSSISRGPAEVATPSDRRFDPSTRRAVAALAVAIVALGVAEALRNAWSIWGLWLLGAISLLVALWSANRGRRRVTTHPEKLKGLGLSVAAMVVAVGGLLIVAISVDAAVGSAPASDAPAGLGSRTSVESARWGYHRLRRVADGGWNRPAKDAGTCWSESAKADRDPERIEVGTLQESCELRHTTEVVDVYAYDRDADAPYPGRDALARDASDRCADLVDAALNPKGAEPIQGLLVAEVPTKQGWEDADHDVACAIVTAVRQGALLPS